MKDTNNDEGALRTNHIPGNQKYDSKSNPTSEHHTPHALPLSPLGKIPTKTESHSIHTCTIVQLRRSRGRNPPTQALQAKRQYEGIRLGLAIAHVRSVHTQNSPSQNIGPLKTIKRHHTQSYNRADECDSKRVESSRLSAIHLQQLTG